MTPLYQKAKKYDEMTKEYWKEYKAFQKEKWTELRIMPKDFSVKLRMLYDALPDFNEHFEEEIYEPHGLFQAKVWDIEIHILYGHEEIKVITPEETFATSTR